MVRLERHGDVTRVHLASRRSRLIGYSASAYLVRGVLVDTGFHAVRRDVSRLVDEMRPRGAVVTHEHEDHAGNVELLARRGVTAMAEIGPGRALAGLIKRIAKGVQTHNLNSVKAIQPEGERA